MKFQTRVIFRESTKCFFDTETKKNFKGITKLMKKQFYPKYSFAKAPKGVPVAKKGGVRARAGRARGTKVDKQLASIVNGKKCKALHPFTKSALSAIKQSGMKTLAAQVVVFDEVTKVATAIDILCQDTDGMLAVVELKCSSDNKYNSACGQMKGALAERDDSLASQHILQAQITRMLFEKTYGVQSRAYVLRVNGSGVTLTRAPRSGDVLAGYKQMTRTK